MPKPQAPRRLTRAASRSDPPHGLPPLASQAPWAIIPPLMIIPSVFPPVVSDHSSAEQHPMSIPPCQSGSKKGPPKRATGSCYNPNRVNATAELLVLALRPGSDAGAALAWPTVNP